MSPIGQAASSLLRVGLELIENFSQLGQGDVLQLANPLAREAEPLADLLERLLLLAVEAESADQDFHFAIRQLADEQAQDAADVFV
jgi:hypothetical protein